MARSAPDPNGPEDVDAAFAEIIADLEREGFGSTAEKNVASDKNSASDKNTEKDDGGSPEDPEVTERPGSGDLPASGATHASSWRTSDTEWDWGSSDTEHYVPPEPPPLPRLRAGTIIAIVLTAVGVFLLVAPGVVGLPLQVSAPLALVLLAGGLGLLLLRLRPDPPDTGPDDGAQL